MLGKDQILGGKLHEVKSRYSANNNGIEPSTVRQCVLFITFLKIILYLLFTFILFFTFIIMFYFNVISFDLLSFKILPLYITLIKKYIQPGLCIGIQLFF